MNLNLSIEVNEENFTNICENTLQNLPEDKLQEVVLKAVEAALTATFNYDKTTILTDKRGEPTTLCRQLLEKANFEKYFEPVAEKIVNYLIKNYEHIVLMAMVTAFSNLLFTQTTKDEILSTCYSMIKNNCNLR